MSSATARSPSRRGRPATASRDDVLRAARAQFLAGQRVDVTIVARELGLGRATIYRWFGSREHLLADVIATELEALVSRARGRVRQRGARGLLEVFDRVNRWLTHSTALRRFVEQERAAALRLLTASDGSVQPRSVACITELIASEAAAGRYDPPADPQTLAYAIVRLAEAFLYNDAAFGIRGDHARLREVEAALLGVPRATPSSGAQPSSRPRSG
jgi:AcrR family transcriptional regulator